MDVFALFYKLAPKKSHPQYAKLKQVYIDLWVRDMSLSGARINAHKQIEHMDFEILHCYGELQVNDMDILSYADLAQMHYNEAKLLGIAYSIDTLPDNIFIPRQ